MYAQSIFDFCSKRKRDYTLLSLSFGESLRHTSWEEIMILVAFEQIEHTRPIRTANALTVNWNTQLKL